MEAELEKLEPEFKPVKVTITFETREELTYAKDFLRAILDFMESKENNIVTTIEAGKNEN